MHKTPEGHCLQRYDLEHIPNVHFGELLCSSPGFVVPAAEEATHALFHVLVQRLSDRLHASIAEVVTPASDRPIEVSDYPMSSNLTPSTPGLPRLLRHTAQA